MVAKVGETPSLTREFIGKWARDKQVGCVIPSLAPPPQAAGSIARRLLCPDEYLRPCPLTTEQVHRDKRNMTQMKEQSKTSERELSDEEIANLSDGEFKALVIKMLTDLIELGQKKNK